MSNSPFFIHRDKVLGHYGTADWLRQLVLAMADGGNYPVDLRYLAGLDNNHIDAAIEMLDAFARTHGNDPDFSALVRDILQRKDEESAAHERGALQHEWLSKVRHALLDLGGRADMTDDCWSWFEQRFDAGDAPVAAARAAIAERIDPALPENRLLN